MARGESLTQTQSAHTLLVVDDERSLRFSIGEWARDAGFQPLEAPSGREALEPLREQSVDVVLLDLKLGDEDGMEVLQRLREEDPSLPGGHAHRRTAPSSTRCSATKLGAYDFILKPPDLDHLGVVLHRALEHARLQREVEHLRDGVPLGEQTLIGESPGLKQRAAAARQGRARAAPRPC